MLQLNPDQMRNAGIGTARDAAVRILVEQFDTAKALPREELEGDVEHLLLRARSHGLTTIAAAGVFVLLSWAYGKGFESEDAELLGMLKDPRLAPQEKSRCLQIWALGAAVEL